MYWTQKSSTMVLGCFFFIIQATDLIRSGLPWSTSQSYLMINILPQQVTLTLLPLQTHLLHSSYQPSLLKTFPCHLLKERYTFVINRTRKTISCKVKKCIEKQATCATPTADCHLHSFVTNFKVTAILHWYTCFQRPRKLNLQHMQQNYRKQAISLLHMLWHWKIYLAPFNQDFSQISIHSACCEKF